MAARGASYFALAFCHAWSIAAGSCAAVGAAGETGAWECIRPGAMAKPATTRVPRATLRIDAYGSRNIWVFPLSSPDWFRSILTRAGSPPIAYSYDKVIGDSRKTQTPSHGAERGIGS